MAGKLKNPNSVIDSCSYMTADFLKSYEYKVADGKDGIEIDDSIWGSLYRSLQAVVDRDDYQFGTTVTIPIQPGDFVKVLTDQKVEGAKSIEFFRAVKLGNDKKYYVRDYLKINDITGTDISAEGILQANNDEVMRISFWVMSDNMSGYSCNIKDDGTALDGKSSWKGGQAEGG